MNAQANGSVGVAGRVPAAVRRGKVAKGAPSGKAGRKAMSARRWVAAGVGGVGSCLLSLSVAHCADALGVTTGQPAWACWAMAVGIDCGLVGCEVATTVAGKHAKRWARGYVVASVLLSALLNALASGQHAAPGYQALGYGVGAIVPVLVLVLGVVASRLWTEG